MERAGTYCVRRRRSAGSGIRSTRQTGPRSSSTWPSGLRQERHLHDEGRRDGSRPDHGLRRTTTSTSPPGGSSRGRFGARQHGPACDVAGSGALYARVPGAPGLVHDPDDERDRLFERHLAPLLERLLVALLAECRHHPAAADRPRRAARASPAGPSRRRARSGASEAPRNLAASSGRPASSASKRADRDGDRGAGDVPQRVRADEGSDEPVAGAGRRRQP